MHPSCMLLLPLPLVSDQQWIGIRCAVCLYFLWKGLVMIAKAKLLGASEIEYLDVPPAWG